MKIHQMEMVGGFFSASPPGSTLGEWSDVTSIGLSMLSRSILDPILGNEALTRGLADPEARILIEWLVTQAEKIAARLAVPENLHASVEKMCRRARGISRFVFLWSNPASRGAACQLAATERYSWPLPSEDMDPCELMLEILSHETAIPA